MLFCWECGLEGQKIQNNLESKPPSFINIYSAWYVWNISVWEFSVVSIINPGMFISLIIMSCFPKCCLCPAVCSVVGDGNWENLAQLFQDYYLDVRFTLYVQWWQGGCRTEGNWGPLWEKKKAHICSQHFLFRESCEFWDCCECLVVQKTKTQNRLGDFLLSTL